MKKKLNTYWLVESSGDLSLTVKTLATVKKLIEGDVEGVSDEDLSEFQYTITPVFMTAKEFKDLPDGE